MDTTPSKSPRTRRTQHLQEPDENRTRSGTRIRKPPPITPRRFTRFFTPRPRNSLNAVKTSRAALRAISSSNLNSRGTQNRKPYDLPSNSENALQRGKKRKLSFVLADASTQSSPISRLSIAGGEHDLIRSSPTIPERQTPTYNRSTQLEPCDTEDETDVNTEDEDDDSFENAAPQSRLVTFKSRSVAGGLLSARVTGRRARKECVASPIWQNETAHFYSDQHDVYSHLSSPTAAIPFSAASCHTNSLVAIGDEEGRIRLLDTAQDQEHSFSTDWLTMLPHDNAIMDLAFSPDDQYLATAAGDQSCHIIDMPTQTSLYRLCGHRSSVKKVAFQPASGNQVLASCGRDGQINFWDLRCNNMDDSHNARKTRSALPMNSNMKYIAPTHLIRDAHTARVKSVRSGPRAKSNVVPSRSDYSITSLAFLGESKPHLLVTASETNSTIKLWDIRTSYGKTRCAPTPLSITQEPRNQAGHRSFGITSLAVSTDGSRLYSLSRDHTVYAYATSHLILGSSNHLSKSSKASRPLDNYEGAGPLYGFRHPSMRIQTFWPRLSIRKATDAHSELLAVGSSNDCAVLFPTDERYFTSSTKMIPTLHQQQQDSVSFNSSQTQTQPPRPTLTRSSSSSTSFNNRLIESMQTQTQDSNPLPIYHHGTPLIRGHEKEVTSLVWSSGGDLITASDDYTVRCWRENPTKAREMRVSGEQNGVRWLKGWSDVGIVGFDEDDDDEV